MTAGEPACVRIDAARIECAQRDETTFGGLDKIATLYLVFDCLLEEHCATRTRLERSSSKALRHFSQRWLSCDGEVDWEITSADNPVGFAAQVVFRDENAALLPVLLCRRARLRKAELHGLRAGSAGAERGPIRKDGQRRQRGERSPRVRRQPRRWHNAETHAKDEQTIGDHSVMERQQPKMHGRPSEHEPTEQRVGNSTQGFSAPPERRERRSAVTVSAQRYDRYVRAMTTSRKSARPVTDSCRPETARQALRDTREARSRRAPD